MNTDTITFVTVQTDPDGNVFGLDIEHGAGSHFKTGNQETIDLILSLLPGEDWPYPGRRAGGGMTDPSGEGSFE